MHSHSHQLTTNKRNPLAKDPTRTTTIRRRFMTDLRKRFLTLASIVRTYVKDQLGLDNEMDYRTDEQRLEAFSDWLKMQIKTLIFSHGDTPATTWMLRYIEAAYQRGINNALGMAGKEQDTPMPAVMSVRNQMVTLARRRTRRSRTHNKPRMLTTRPLKELEGVTARMASKMEQILSEGMISGSGANQIAKAIVEEVGLSRSRAMTIARTEIIFAQAEAQLDAFEQLGVEELELRVEWTTAGDDRVCPLCEPKEGKVYDIEEARGMIPLHPNCRCSWTPALPERRTRRRRR